MIISHLAANRLLAADVKVWARRTGHPVTEAAVAARALEIRITADVNSVISAAAVQADPHAVITLMTRHPAWL